MARSPISIHSTGAKVLTDTRSVTMGPWKRTKSITTNKATTPRAPISQASER